MWCRTCHREVAAVPTANGAVDCPFCGEATNRLKEFAGDGSAVGSGSLSAIVRTDPSHAKTRRLSAAEPVPAAQRSSESNMHHNDSLGTIASQSWINLAGFFVVIFLIGQTLIVWSFLAGHFGAWALGQIGLSLGLATSLWLLIRQTAVLADQNRVLIQRVNRLQRQARSESSKTSETTAPQRRQTMKKSRTKV